MTRHKRHRPSLRSLYQWHRYLGLAVAILAVLLALTGLMLNHTEKLRLDEQQLNQRWLLQWYGIKSQTGRFFQTGTQWLSQWGDRLYLDRKALSPHQQEELVGAVRLPQMIVAASRDTLLLLTPEGELIERMDSLSGVPKDIQAIARDSADRIVLLTLTGKVIGDPDEGVWEPVTTEASWSTDGTPPETLRLALGQDNSGPTLTLERIILDLHSGRLFGSLGSYVMDGAAVLLLFNAVSGVLIWWRRRRQRERARRS